MVKNWRFREPSSKNWRVWTRINPASAKVNIPVCFASYMELVNINNLSIPAHYLWEIELERIRLKANFIHKFSAIFCDSAFCCFGSLCTNLRVMLPKINVHNTRPWWTNILQDNPTLCWKFTILFTCNILNWKKKQHRGKTFIYNRFSLIISNLQLRLKFLYNRSAQKSMTMLWKTLKFEHN